MPAAVGRMMIAPRDLAPRGRDALAASSSSGRGRGRNMCGMVDFRWRGGGIFPAARGRPARPDPSVGRLGFVVGGFTEPDHVGGPSRSVARLPIRVQAPDDSEIRDGLPRIATRTGSIVRFPASGPLSQRVRGGWTDPEEPRFPPRRPIDRNSRPLARPRRGRTSRPDGRSGSQARSRERSRPDAGRSAGAETSQLEAALARAVEEGAGEGAEEGAEEEGGEGRS